MKKVFANLLIRLSGGQRSTILVAFLGIMVGLGILVLMPLYPIVALRLLGMDLAITLRTYFGSLMLIVFMLWLHAPKIGGKKEGL